MRTWSALFVKAAIAAVIGLGAAPARADLTSLEPPPPARWYDWITASAFVDAYASFNYAVPKPQGGANALRSFDASNGFSLSWAGLDLAHEPDPVGGLIELRFGPSAEVHGATCLSDDRELNPCDSDLGIENVKSAAVLWEPWPGFELRFGKFDSPFGTERAESQKNVSYTRGLLYARAYPLFHTGLGATLEIVPELELDALLVNGWNDTIDNNLGKTFGLGATLRPDPVITVRLGYLTGPEQDDVIRVACPAGSAYSPDSGGCAAAPGADAAVYAVDRGGANDFEAFRHLIDLRVAMRPLEQLYLLLGGYYGVENVKSRTNDDAELDTQRYYAVTLAAQLELSPVWAVAARGEYLRDPDGLASGDVDGELVSATLTVDARIAEALLVRLENRGDFELRDHELFAKKTRDTTAQQFTTTLGVVVTTN